LAPDRAGRLATIHPGGGRRRSDSLRRGRIEIKILAGDHQDFAGRAGEEVCSAAISLRPRFVDTQHLAGDHRIKSIMLRRETSITKEG
jgi:hypothetical protein